MSDSTADRSPQAGPTEHHRLIVAEDEEVVIEHHFEDWLAFAIFWGLALIVFLQFFTRYVLNDSLAWTEEIARYGLMWVTFIGAAMVTRRNSHIAVVLLTELLPAGPARLLRALIDTIVLAFLGLLAYFAVLILERMQFQRMTVIDLPMSLVYGGVALGCFLMLYRQVRHFWRNAREGWRVTQHLPGQYAPTDETRARP